MNKMILALGLATAALALSSAPAQAQMTVGAQPRRPAGMARRPVAPRPDYVWIDEDWRWWAGTYSWHGGRWARPPFRGALWFPGHWKKLHYGWHWFPGRWRRTY